MRKLIFLIFRKIVKIFLGTGLSKFPPVAFVFNFLLTHLYPYVKPEQVKILGHKMFLHPRTSPCFSLYGICEKFETNFLEKKIKKNMVVLDLGANIGYYTLIAAKLVGEKGKVYAFEPAPDNFALLKKNIEVNGYKNVVLVQKAVSNKSGQTRLFLSQDPTCHLIYDPHDNSKSVIVDVISLEDFFKNHNDKIDLIKMDIEGAEGWALQGMKNLIEKNKDMEIITEFRPFGLRKSGYPPEKYLSDLKELGFKLYDLNEQEEKIKPIDDINKFLQMYGGDKYTNLLCTR